jgi:hypothetical protein
MQPNHSYIVSGILTDNHTVKLDRAVPLEQGKVRIVIEPLTQTERRSYANVMGEIRHRQKARSYQPPTREQVDAYLHTERESWDK